jgi:hypothetical protein
MPSSSPQPVQQNSVSKSEPWAAQQPHLTQVFGEAERLYKDPSNPTFFPGQTYASPSGATNAALGAIENRAMSGSPLMGQANTEMGKVLAGDYLNPASNPGFSSMVDSVRANVLPGIDSRFMGAGRSGSGLHGRAVGEGLGSAIGQLTYQNYGDERNRMTNAMGMAPQFAMADYNDAAMLGQVGAAREGQAQNQINEDMARHEFNANLPQNKLANYAQMVQGNYGGTNTTTGTQYLPPQNMFSQVLGGLMGGTGILGSTGAFGKTGWLFSDERLKDDMEPVGETYDGDTIYRYTYKGSNTPMFGVSAQEVAKTKPHAVARDPSGYLAVNYGAL